MSNEPMSSHLLSICRCCLAEGKFRSLTRKYKWINGIEMYGEMLLDCFGIDLSKDASGECHICGVCITQLRHASNFKHQILDSQRKFLSICPTAIKIEQPEEDNEEVCDGDGAVSDDGIECEMSEGVKVKVEESSKQETVNADSLASLNHELESNVEPKGRRKRRTTLKKKTQDKDASMFSSQDATKHTMSSTKRNRMMKKNAIIFLESSNVMPFKWHRQHYLCFFCHKPFKNPQLLKEHSLKEHKSSSIKNAVTYLKRDEQVKINVTNITCKHCCLPVEDMASLKSHLKVTHKKIFAEEFKDGIIPYKLDGDDFECAVCGKKFQYFIKLNQHMNSHYGDYICESCGKSFLSLDRLRCHALSHGGRFKCVDCLVIFDSITQRNNHICVVHNKGKSFKCLHCSEIFTSYALRKKHHKSAHNVDVTEFKCPVCSKAFHIMSKMQAHLKQVHIREKNYSCDVCEQRFFSKKHVKKHMIRHYGERVHECNVCKKSYARKQTLRDHMRIHSDNRRFVCAICSQGFVQKTGLERHTRVHHPETSSG